MKKIIKILFFIFAISLCLTSCEKYNDEVILNNCDKNILDINTDDNYRYTVSVIEFEYKGHQYLGFKYWKEMSFVHDPNCKCKNNKK